MPKELNVERTPPQSNHSEIILYAAGAGGDMVTATIDPRLYTWNTEHSHLMVCDERAFLRRRWLIAGKSSSDINHLLTSHAYKSIASHEVEFHIKQNHDFILIDSSDDDYADWAAKRFNQILINVKQVNRRINANYHIQFCERAKLHTNRIIKLQDIFEGKLLQRLTNLTDASLDSIFYDEWLIRNKL